MTQSETKPSAVSRITDEKIRNAMRAIDAKANTSTKGAANALTEKYAKSSGRGAQVIRDYSLESGDIFYFEHHWFLLGYLLDALNKARAQKRVAVLSYLVNKRIVIDGVRELVGTDMTDQQIRSLALVPVSDDSTFTNHIRYFNQAETGADATALPRVMSTEVFFWNLGMLTSRGRVTPETPLYDAVYLKRWPNLARVQLSPNAVRIISHWINRPASLLQMFEFMQVPLKDIFYVYSAAETAGLLSMSDPSGRAAAASSNADDNRGMRRLFSSILGRLKRSAGSEQARA